MNLKYQNYSEEVLPLLNCGVCGQKLEDHDEFCIQCGASTRIIKKEYEKPDLIKAFTGLGSPVGNPIVQEPVVQYFPENTPAFKYSVNSKNFALRMIKGNSESLEQVTIRQKTYKLLGMKIIIDRGGMAAPFEKFIGNLQLACPAVPNFRLDFLIDQRTSYVPINQEGDFLYADLYSDFEPYNTLTETVDIHIQFYFR